MTHQNPEIIKHAADAAAALSAWTAVFDLVTGFFGALAAIASFCWYAWRFYRYVRGPVKADDD